MSENKKLYVHPEHEMHICSICGEDYQGWGNNAYPVNEGRCCNDCNTIVINHRIANMRRMDTRK
jgi:hypothetical protein